MDPIRSSTQPRILWVSGPLRLRVVEGTARILGASLGEGAGIVVHRDRSYMVELEPGSALEVESGLGVVRDAQADEVEAYREWLDAVERVTGACRGSCRVAVMGPVDAGKTSLLTLIANRLLEQGRGPVEVLDTDLGQSTYGLPGFVVRAQIPAPTLWERTPRASRMSYVGSITPAGWEHQVIASSLSLLLEEPPSGPLLVDTDGWFTGTRALRYKAELAARLGVDWVLVVGAPPGEGGMFKRISPAPTLFLRSPPRRVVRDARERRMLRGDKLYLVDSLETLLVNLGETPLLGTVNLGLGEPLAEEELARLGEEMGVRPVYGERLGGKTILLAKNRPRQRPPGGDTVVLGMEALRGLLVSLADERGRDYTYGIITGADEARRLLILRTPQAGRVPKVIRTGVIRYQEDSIVMDTRLRTISRLTEA